MILKLYAYARISYDIIRTCIRNEDISLIAWLALNLEVTYRV